MSLLPSYLRDDEDYLVDDPKVIQLACWARSVDTDRWYSGEVPDDVWEIVDADLIDEVTGHIERGATWKDAYAAVKDRL